MSVPLWSYAVPVSLLAVSVYLYVSGQRKNHPDKLREYAEAKQLARRLADRGEYFMRCIDHGFSDILLQVHTADQERIQDEAQFPKGHLDGEKLLSLTHLVRIRFEYSEQPVVNKKLHFVGNYLRVRAG